jgi:hypothetical protein
MPNLIQSLQAHDLAHLRIVAGLWGLDLASGESEAALKELASALLDPGLEHEIVDSLPEDARSALEGLLEAGNRMPWVVFARQYGEIREAGPGRRDREQIYLNPVSTAELLFYRAFLARAFFDTPNGAQEFAYIPEDLAEVIRQTGQKEFQGKPGAPLASAEVKSAPPAGRPATPREYKQPVPASDRLLDDAVTFLAALRMGHEPPEMQVPARLVEAFLKTARIMDDQASQPEQVKSFLEMSRRQALILLTDAWRESPTFNELRLVPSLACEGEWTNQPLGTRAFLLRLLEALPKSKWWSLPAFIQAVKELYPDFQRPAGDYDSWFIKRKTNSEYLRGFATWNEVDGALIHYLITGPMFWLELVELATPEGNESISAFRINEKQGISSENGRLAVSSNGRITVPRLVPRVARYLIARFCEWDEARPDEYHYHVTIGSLKKAREQGLRVGQLLSLLAKNSASEIPPVFIKALKRWELNGTEARLQVQTILRVSRPEVLEELRKSRAGRFLGETLGPVTAVIKPGAQSKVQAALTELGLLAEYIPTSMPDAASEDRNQQVSTP